MKLTFYEFTMGDVDDVDIYVAQPISKWQDSLEGQWVMEHAKNLKYYTTPDPHTLGYRITIRGEIPEGPLLTEWLLRYR